MRGSYKTETENYKTKKDWRGASTEGGPTGKLLLSSGKKKMRSG